MDTKYWGPSGWKLLHLIAEKESTSKITHKDWSIHRHFWSLIPYILPCKFCRASLSIYYEKHSIPHDNRQMRTWLYKIHNLVNAKLREQGQIITDPPYESVKKHYSDLLNADCTGTEFPGWEFLFCIADNYPGTSPSKPMPDTPLHILSANPKDISLKIRNKYNLLTDGERIESLSKFWAIIPQVLPFPVWSAIWAAECEKTCGSDFRGRAPAKRRVWKIKCAMDKELHKESEDTYYGLCRKVASKRSGCSTSKNALTCRAIKKTQKKKRVL